MWKHYYFAGVLLAIIYSITLAYHSREYFEDRYEDTTLLLFPSASRAFAYGEQHFSASNISAYDIDRAEHLFYIAATLNPQLPYIYHELARIAFLHGDLPTALARINLQIAQEGDAAPASYYMRGLIEGYMNDYVAAAADYQHFLNLKPISWAGTNDYAWILLKANKAQEAVRVTSAALETFPNNPWLLNSYATALYETGSTTQAAVEAQKAVEAVAHITEAQWLLAYPGNDPRIARVGIVTFQKAVAANLHTILLATTTHMIE